MIATRRPFSGPVVLAGALIAGSWAAQAAPAESSSGRFPPPRFGDRVVRGPDWNKGSADGEAGLPGTIIKRSPEDPSPRGRDGYVTVQWDATKRKGRYRWDYHRKFDVIPATVEQAAAGDGAASGNP